MLWEPVLGLKRQSQMRLLPSPAQLLLLLLPPRLVILTPPALLRPL